MTTRLIVITGVTRGLGRSMAEGFIRLGHTVLGCGRSAVAVDELNVMYGDKDHRFDVVDVANDSAVQEWARRSLDRAGSPDLLINNAALVNQNAPLWQVPAGEFSAVIDVNIKGVASVIRHFTPAMIARGRGVIVNFSSGWGRSVDSEVAPYCATKWAIEGLTKALAQELPQGMAAVPLNPGIINTDMLRISFGLQAQHFPEAMEWANTAVPWLLGLGPEHNGRSLTVGDRY
ncbi:SDR family oxidoreductase [Candidatus Nitrotoga fabula]|uniref:Short-chain alcohol dehydrogenase n=1 Tax=Candidatus Nitrotoga fabula TaxID=2182327 RepID=A0A916FA58_9PROT|nr:SDR family NAD(P)-dependent oxidoreductase [Candidatus Nitrotoga fabula]CAE6689087.1 Short-chain alcohol dehydrogenase [Candidatus Nitrotoga fabula]